MCPHQGARWDLEAMALLLNLNDFYMLVGERTCG